MSTTTADIKMSQQKAEALIQEPISEISRPSVAAPYLTPIAQVQYVVLKAVDKKKKRFRIDGVCHNVTNPKTNKQETIYNVRGWPSIWASELVEQLKDKEYFSRNRLSIQFVNGVCRLPIKEVNQIEFAKYNLNNVGKQRNTNGKWDFYVYDVNEEAKERLAKENNKIQTIVKVSNLPAEKIRTLAGWFKISFSDDIGMPKEPDALKTELLLLANQSPDLVERYIDAKEVDIAFKVRTAILDAKIDLGNPPGTAIWAEGKGFIVRIPTGKTPYDYLTDLALSPTPEGKEFLSRLSEAVK